MASGHSLVHFDITVGASLSNGHVKQSHLRSFWQRHSDRSGERCLHIAIPLAVGLLGFMIAMSTMNLYLRYMSM